MRKVVIRVICLVVGLLAMVTAYSQSIIEVADLTVKVPANSEEILHYGFFKGDKIKFDFTEIDGKELKELEVFEYPSTSKFQEFKTTRVTGKEIQVSKTGIYGFRFTNGHIMSGRICKIKLSRIPAPDAPSNFNSAVDWKTVIDTTWNTYTKDVLVGYDTLKALKTRKVVAKCDTIEELLIDKGVTVHSTMNSNGSIEWVEFLLPVNIKRELEEKKTLSWAYWIGVGDESNAAWEKNSRAVKTAVKGVASLTLTPLGALAVGLVTDLITVSAGEDVQYLLLDGNGVNNLNGGLEYQYYDRGTVVNAYRFFTHQGMQQGRFYVRLSNDNVMTPIVVYVKVSAIVKHTVYRMEEYTDLQVSPRYQKQAFRDPIVKQRKVPVMVEN